MSAEWKMVLLYGELNLGRGLLAYLSYASGISARETCLLLVCQPTTGNHLLQIEANGRPCAVRHSKQGRQSLKPKPTQSEQSERLLQRQLHQAISVGTVAVSAVHELD